MATAALKGNAYFTYTPAGSAAIVHQLAIPLWNKRVVDRRARFDWWAEDFNTREVINLATGVYEIDATIRFDNEPTELRYMLRTALQEDLVLYYTNGATYPVRLVAVLGASDADEVPLDPDRDRHGYGEWECRVQLRRTDGGTLDGAFT